jgi:putative spermidine/putrescine transport system permease protein
MAEHRRSPDGCPGVRQLSAYLVQRPVLLTLLLLLPPLLWICIIYLATLAAFLWQSIYALDDFSGVVIYEPTLASFRQLFTATNFGIIVRTVTMAACVTVASAMLAYPLSFYAARHAKGRWKAAFYLLVMLPLWSSYLVKLYSWKLILAKEGILSWIAAKLHASWIIDGILSINGIGGPSLSTSYIGTFIVFVYIWLPYMILPTQAAIERVPGNLLEASADLGGKPAQTFRHVIWPLALPGLVAGSIFTFSLTLGDYIIPQVVGGSVQYLGNAVYQYQGTAGNIPLAAAFTLVPIFIMLVYLTAAKKMGAFDAI